MPRLSRWTPFVFARPEKYVSRGVSADFDIEGWSATTFDWRQDRFNGWLDIAKPPIETMSDGYGDCEDYALVGASYEVAKNSVRDRAHEVSLGFYFPKHSPIPRHVVCYTGGPEYERVYSSGTIVEDANLREYLDMSPYEWYIERDIA